MEDKLHFKTNIQIKSIIGKDLINDDNIAILELVKNSFDADAKRVDISFYNIKRDLFNEPSSISQLIIRDNGEGMNLDDIREKWLNIAYSEKKKNTRQHNRMMAGAKGVGRFSCDRLGQFLNLYAKKANEECVLLKIDWSKFEIDDQNKEVQSIDLEYDIISDAELNNRGFSNFKRGVILEITNLRSNWVQIEKGKWNTEKLTKLKKYLEKLINPNQAFEKNDFGIYLNADEFELENKQLPQSEQFIGKIENTIFQKLDFKATSIECRSIDGGTQILTTLKDKGEIIYWIKESSDFFPAIQDFRITLYYLNTYAKAFFLKQTGIRSVSYGSIFLFLNGFRVPPYGEEGDDWLKLEQRRTQGYARYISARDLVGQIEIMDANESFRIISSREGLVKNENYVKLTDSNGLFYKVLRRLERYVVDGLNWDSIPEKDKSRVSDIEKKIVNGEITENDLQFQEDAKTKRSRIYGSIHYIINANPQKVVELYINENLIESKIEEQKQLAEQEFSKLLSDFENKKISGDLLSQILQRKAQESKELEKQLADFSKYTTTEATAKAIAEIQSFKDTVEKQAKMIAALQKQLEEKSKEIASIYTDTNERVKEAEQKQKEAEHKQKEAEQKQKEAEADRDIAKQKNKYLIATRNTTKEVQDLMHVILISSTSSMSLVSTAKYQLADHDYEAMKITLDKFEYYIAKINKLSKMITKADVSLLSESNLIDIQSFIQEYLSNYADSLEVEYHSTIFQSLEKKISILDLSIIMDNLVSNSVKANATKLRIDFSRTDRTFVIDFTDNGVGVDLNQFTPNSIFEEGITNRRGGSGIGLSTIKDRMEKELNGSIEFLGNGLFFNAGATFRLTFN